ncbi:hypothetical protein JCM5296_003524 [Sporobolomyces johnsonii]
MIRPLSPTLLRGPSPLGGKSFIVKADGRIVTVEPPRPASAPPVQPATRPLSPGSASTPLRPPVHHAQKTSRRELQKIDCRKLQELLNAVLREFGNLARSIMTIEGRISRHWTVPTRAARLKVKEIVLTFTANATYLIKYLQAVSIAARKILNFVATCIKDSHGLRDFTAVQDLKPVIDELKLLHSHWAALQRSENAYGDLLSNATLVLEEAMDPDDWKPDSPVSPPVLELASSHLSLESSFTQVALFFKDLGLASWQPPLLSPSDVKLAAGAWREIEHAGLTAAGVVRALVKQLLDSTVDARFMGRGDGENAFRAFAAGTTTTATTPVGAAAGSSGISGPTRLGSQIVRPSTTMGRGAQ